MKKVTIPILNDEYLVDVIIGSDVELAKYITKHCHKHKDFEDNLEYVQNTRGSTWNRMVNGQNVLIAMNASLDDIQFIATLAHEASHAAHYIMEYTSLKDPSDEFRAYSIGAIVRKTLKSYTKDKRIVLSNKK